MNQVHNLKQLSDLSYFDKNTLSQFVELSDRSLYAAINRWIKSGKIVQLKKGFYATSDYVDRMSGKPAYLEFIANRLRLPSYLSLEYVLQKFGVLSESVFAITSVTLKSKRVYKNKLGTFMYRGISERLFTGYLVKPDNGFEVKEASKTKALFDYLYLKLFRIKSPNRELISSLRLNLDEFADKDRKEFDRYCQMPGMRKYQKLPSLLFNR